MKLYYSPGACSLAPHILLKESGLDFEIERVDLASRKTESGADFSTINPKGYIPTLRLDSEENLSEGVVIQQYIADKAPGAKLAPARGTMERLRLEETLVFLSTEIHKAFGPLFGGVPDEAKPFFKDKIAQRFGYLANELSDKQYLMGEQFSAADAYLFTMLGWAPHVGIDVGQWPVLSAYSQRVASRPAVQAALRAEGLLS